MGRLDKPAVDGGMRLTVDMKTIRAYARLTQDFNPLHVDPDFAAKTAMGDVIAHGTMSLGLVLLAAVDSYLPDGAAVELDVRFITPVRVGDVLEPLLHGEPDGDRLKVSVRGADGIDRIGGTLRVHHSRAS
jgi:3-hydroxybutyryl-CoA dehydratase